MYILLIVVVNFIYLFIFQLDVNQNMLLPGESRPQMTIAIQTRYPRTPENEKKSNTTWTKGKRPGRHCDTHHIIGFTCSKRDFKEFLLIHRLLDPSNSWQFDDFKKCYGEILHRWGMKDKRAEVLKFVSCPPEPHKGIGKLQEWFKTASGSYSTIRLAQEIISSHPSVC